jgi:hypothetical protein
MGYDGWNDLQFTFQYSQNPSVFVTTPQVGGTCLHFAETNDAVVSHKWWVLNEQRKAFALIVWLGQSRIPHIWELNIVPSSYDNRASDLYQLSGVAWRGILHALMRPLNIAMLIIYCVLECREDLTNQLSGAWRPSAAKWWRWIMIIRVV